MVGRALFYGVREGLFAHEEVRGIQAVVPSRRRLNVQGADSVCDDVRSGGAPFYGSACDDDRFPGRFETKSPSRPCFSLLADRGARVFHFSRGHVGRGAVSVDNSHVSAWALVEHVRVDGVIHEVSHPIGDPYSLE